MANVPEDTLRMDKHWDIVLRQLKDLSTITVHKNVELVKRVAELEEELAVWKQARTATLEAAERDKRAQEDQVIALRNRVANLEAHQQLDSLVFCVIDGDGCIFNESYVSAGKEGGQNAAQRLSKSIAEQLSRDGIQLRGVFSFWVTLYINRRTLDENLVHKGLCSAEQLDEFLLGFSQASPRFLIVETGQDRENLRLKIIEYVQTYARFPQTIRVFFGIGQATEYMRLFAALNEERLLSKLVVISGIDLSTEMWALRVPTLIIDGLLQHRSLPTSPTDVRSDGTHEQILDDFFRTSLSPAPNGHIHNGSSQFPRSPPKSGKLIDPNLPLNKQMPPPCNEHYLMRCPRGSNCKFGHEYELTPEQLVTLAKNAKKAPCNYHRKGQECPLGDRCCWGHVCPKGPQCFHNSQGKCWFKGPSAHAAVDLPDYGASYTIS